MNRKVTVEEVKPKQPYHGEGKNGPYTIRKWEVTEPDGNTVELNTVDKTWEPKAGETYECEDKTKNERFPTFSPILPKQSGFQGGGKKGYAPRDYAAEERAKHPSFALSYAKDFCHGKSVSEVLKTADEFLGWLTAHALKGSTTSQEPRHDTNAAPDGWIQALTDAGLGGEAKKAGLQRHDLEKWWGENPQGFLERVKAAIKGDDLPWG